jgi:hypothetical protein
MEYSAVIAEFESLLEDVRGTQASTLAALLGVGAGGTLGRRYGLERVRDVDSFRRQVPLATYEDLRPLLEADVTRFAGETPLALLSTSASTGKPKRIPYTPAFRDSIRRAHNVFSAAILRDFPSLPLESHDTPRGLGLYQVSSAEQSYQGVAIDSYVSRLFDVAFPNDPFFFALPRPIYGVANASSRLYAMALVAAGWDIRALRATNPTTLLLFARILAESTDALIADVARGRPSDPELEPILASVVRPNPTLSRQLAALGRSLRPRDLWPNLELLVTWRGGTCHLYEPFLQELFGPVRLRAPIFAASEGVIAIPLADDMAGGVPAVSSTFLEFRPLDETGDRTYLLDELDQGARYELILTAPNGMFRYLIGDIVEVEGRFGKCPTLRFVARKGRTSSLTGEKLTELQVEDAVRRASSALGMSPLFWLLSAKFGALPCYVLSVEWGGQGAPRAHRGAHLAAQVDRELGQLNVEYSAKRDSDRLGPIELQEVATGEFERLQARGLSGRGAANFKLPHLSGEPLHESLKGSCP